MEPGGLCLPATEHVEEFLTAVRESDSVIVHGPCACGKTTVLPSALERAGYRVKALEPRRIAACSAAEFVAAQRGERLGDTVGYRTALERCDSDKTRLLFVTDGLALMHELSQQCGNYDVLVVDEIHERNANMDLVLALAKQRRQRGEQFKLVLMSATLQVERLQHYLDGAREIEIPGRLFPVTNLNPGYSIEHDAAKQLARGRNVLIFQPGKREIRKTIATLRHMGVKAVILPLHRELSWEEQSRVFAKYGIPKCVVATPIAESSITIPDIDVVILSGLVRVRRVKDGTDGLFLESITQDETIQMAGRGARTHPGLVIDHGQVPFEEREVHREAEILRTCLASHMLRLANAGLKIEDLDLLQRPRRAAFAAARRKLQALGLLTDKNRVTALGDEVSRIPLSSVESGRMIVEGARLGVLPTVLVAAAIRETGGIIDPRNGAWRRLTKERESDVLAQVDVFRAAQTVPDEYLEDLGVLPTSFGCAEDYRDHLLDVLHGMYPLEETGTRQDVLRAVCAGMVNNLYRYVGFEGYRNSDEGGTRILSRHSVLPRVVDFVVGSPFDLEVPMKNGDTRVLNLLTMATRVTPALFCSVAPHLTTVETGLWPEYDPELGSVVSRRRFHFQGALVLEQYVPDDQHPLAPIVFARWLAERGHVTREVGSSLRQILERNRKRIAEAEALNVRAGKTVFPVASLDELSEFYGGYLQGARSLNQIPDEHSLVLPFDDHEAARIVHGNPERAEVGGRLFPLTYRTGEPPMLRVKLEDFLSVFGPLQDGKVVLPNERDVRIDVFRGSRRIASSVETAEVKRQVAEDIRQRMWKLWRRPAVALPDLDLENPGCDPVALPEIATAEYAEGHSAYCALFSKRHDGKRRPVFSMVWYATRREAEQSQSAAAGALESYRNYRRKQLENKRPSTQLGTKSDREFRAEYRRGFLNRVQSWVLTPNGQLRKPAKSVRRTDEQVWGNICANDLVISYRAAGASEDGQASFTIVQSPLAGVTAKQRRTIGWIEGKKLRVPSGSFGVAPQKSKGTLVVALRGAAGSPVSARPAQAAARLA